MPIFAAQVLRERANFYIDAAAHCRSSLMFDQLLRLAADCAELAARIERDLAGLADDTEETGDPSAC
jgi:hypothetical protein